MSKTNVIRDKDRFLVVGTDGQLGGALFQDLLKCEENVIGTTYHQKRVTQNVIYLDLSQPPKSWEIPDKITVAFICTAITKLDVCQKDPEGSAKVNVLGAFELTKRLLDKGVYVCVMSSGHIFDGTQPYHKPDDICSPADEYGAQKAAMEEKIKTLGGSVGIIRPARLIGPGFSRITEWKEKLLSGDILNPFSDYALAPIPYSTVITLQKLMAQKRTKGIVQISSTKDISYADMALIGAKALKVSPSQVKPITALEAKYKGQIFRHTCLDITRLRETFGIEPPSAEWTIQKAFTAPELLI